MAIAWWPGEDGSLLALYFPDFLLATAFFTSLTFMVLGQRFRLQRSAAVASLAIGLALATGLVWWELEHDLSIRSLGPFAAGLALLLLAAVMYRALASLGGSFAGIGLTLGISVLLGWALGVKLPIRQDVIQLTVTVALLVGMIALAGHRHSVQRKHPQLRQIVPTLKRDRRESRQVRNVADWIRHNLRRARSMASELGQRPGERSDVMLQLKRMLPAEGYLTERLAALRERVHQVREGHASQIKDISKEMRRLPKPERGRMGKELSLRYKGMKLDLRLERLDRACAENERRIRALTEEAQKALAEHDHRRLTGLLENASKLQEHNARLFKIIDRTEAKLISSAKRIAQQTQEVEHA